MTDERLLDELPAHATSQRPDQAYLRIEGLVEQPLDLAAEELSTFPQTVVTEDFVCEEGWRVPDQVWSGVSVARLLETARVGDEAQWVEFAAADFSFSVPLPEAAQAIVATALNGRPIPHEHGGPARLFVSGGACFTSIKWLDRIEVRATETPNRAAEIARARIR
jgi:DMSO/TMAO reductase YedYZ molybdopterin-dependent catalytic subunit